MSEPNKLEVVKSGRAVARPEDLSVSDMFRGVMDLIRNGRLNSEGVQAAKEALNLCERMEARRAKREFIRAAVQMQAEMKRVVATHAVPGKDGTIKYKVAWPEEIDAQARPIYMKWGFALSFREGKREPGLVTEICVLQHEQGHSEEYPFTVRIGSGPYGATETQADSAAHTTARRRAMCNALNIVVGHEEEDNDLLLGKFITVEEAADLRKRVQATGTVETSFLKFAGAPDFEHIYSARLAELDGFLAKRERVQKAKGPSKTIPADVARQLRDRVLATGADWTDFLIPFQVDKFENLPADRLNEALERVAKLEGSQR